MMRCNSRSYSRPFLYFCIGVMDVGLSIAGMSVASARDPFGPPQLGQVSRAACNQVLDVERNFTQMAAKIDLWEKNKLEQSGAIQALNGIWTDIQGSEGPVLERMSRPDVNQIDRIKANEITERVRRLVQVCRTSVNDFFGSLKIGTYIDVFDRECLSSVRDIHVAYCEKRSSSECQSEVSKCMQQYEVDLTEYYAKLTSALTENRTVVDNVLSFCRSLPTNVSEAQNQRFRELSSKFYTTNSNVNAISGSGSMHMEHWIQGFQSCLVTAPKDDCDISYNNALAHLADAMRRRQEVFAFNSQEAVDGSAARFHQIMQESTPCTKF
jgi:hypothetical protein